MAKKRSEFAGPAAFLSMLEDSFRPQVDDPESPTSWVKLIDPSNGVHYYPMDRHGELRLEVEAKRRRRGIALFRKDRGARVVVSSTEDDQVQIYTLTRQFDFVELGRYRVGTEAEVFAAFPHAFRDVSNALAMQVGS